MLSKLNPGPAFGAFVVVALALAALIVTGHKDALGLFVTTLVGVVTSAITIWRQASPPSSPPSPPVVPPLPVLFVLLALVLVACGAAQRESAKDLYTVQLKACLDNAATRAEAEDCQARIRAEWDDAGAPLVDASPDAPALGLSPLPPVGAVVGKISHVADAGGDQ
jgi:hypothetical protein